MAVERLPNPNDHDLSWLKAGGRGAGARFAATVVLWIATTILTLLFIVYILHQVQGGSQDTSSLHQQLLDIQEPWADKISSDIDSYQGWFQRHGTTSELQVFDDITAFLVQSVLSTSASPSDSLWSSLYVSAHAGVIRALFLIIASIRLCLASIIVAAYFGISHYKPYRGDDILGQTGNGRLFYSGARAGLESLSATGAPDVLIRGLACPDYASKSEVSASAIWRILTKWNATNATNEALAAIIIKHGDTASYIPRLEDEGIYDKTFKGSSLGEHVPHILEAALKLHAQYVAGDIKTIPADVRAPRSLSAASSQEYAQAILGALHQVVSPTLRQYLAQLSGHEIATFVLALESGKVVAHSFEGGKWFRRSNFPHLSARAILHSVLAYPEEYDFESRQRVRQALVYASRTSSFAPVRMPIGMSDDTWALRQWAEILLSTPHELIDAVEEIELVGLVRAAHRKFEQDVLPKASSIVPDLTTTSFATMSELFFLPMTSIVTLLRRTVDQQDLARIAQLSAIVGGKQKSRIEKSQQTDEGAGATLIYDRVFAPIPDSEVTALAQLHSLSAEDVREWSALRNILASFGWLARRVGDYTVPESSVIFSVFKTPAGYPGANALGLIGKSALVPLRGSKFRDVWGNDWDRRFQSFQKATMAESRDDFEKALKGIKDEVEEDASISAPVTV